MQQIFILEAEMDTEQIAEIQLKLAKAGVTFYSVTMSRENYEKQYPHCMILTRLPREDKHGNK